MNEKTYASFLSAGFCLFLSSVLCVNLATADEAFSPTENRTLAQAPEISTETLMDGTFMTSYEKYITDQFAWRDQWVALKSTMEKSLMKQENNSVFFGTHDTLLNKVETPDPEVLDKAAGYVNALSENLSVPLTVGLIPSAANVWAERLPFAAPTADESGIIDDFYGALSGNISSLPLQESLYAHRSEDIFYRTDHHWTSLGAYYGYRTIAEHYGLNPVNIADYTPNVVSDSFYGTIYSSSGVRWVKPDFITTYVPERESLTITSNFTGTPVEGSLYVPSYLSEKDKYSFFLGGIQPLCVIETEHTDAPSILVIRDSYSDSLAPFLTESFSEIHLLDLRFYNASLNSYVEANNIDQVLVLYSLFNFISDGNLFKLAL